MNYYCLKLYFPALFLGYVDRKYSNFSVPFAQNFYFYFVVFLCRQQFCSLVSTNENQVSEISNRNLWIDGKRPSSYKSIIDYTQ